ncbi:MAG: T9SS type A sorting domain-containing protein [Bacteroidetes bacterium]|nr:T9SS type A sorting domain-containing protein [Bacteroidota bacterium]
MAVDPVGNVVGTGFIPFSDTAVFGTITVSNSGNNQTLFVTKMDSDGHYQWTIADYNSNCFVNPIAIRTDKAGCIYVFGLYSSFTPPSIFTINGITFTDSVTSGFILPGFGGSYFLMKLTPTGNVVFIKKIGSGYSEGAIATDSSNNIYILGTSNGITIGADSVVAGTFVAKFDSSGTPLWAFNPISSYNAAGFSVTPGGNFYVIGNYNGTIVVGHDTLRGQGSSLAKYNTDNSAAWGRKLDLNISISAISVDQYENIFLTGSIYGTASIGHDTFISTTNLPFVARYDSLGNPMWARMVMSNLQTYANKISVDTFGEVWISGSMTHTVSMDTMVFANKDTLYEPLMSPDPLFFAQYDACGNFNEAFAVKSGGDDWYGMSVDNHVSLLLCSDYEQSLALGNDTLSAGTESFFVAKYRYTPKLTFAPLHITGSSALCEGSNTILNGSISGGIWTGSNGRVSIDSDTITGISAGIDTITYSLNACFIPANVSVTVNAIPIVDSISGPSLVCVGSTVALTDSTTGGIWAVNNPAASISGRNVKGLIAGMDTIQYIVTNSCGSDTAIYSLSIVTFPVAGTIICDSTVCVGDTISLYDTTPGGIWQVSNTSAIIDGASDIVGNVGGIDTISYTVTNTCGFARANYTITVNPLPVAGVIFGLNNVCVNDTILIDDTTSSSIGNWAESNSNALLFGSQKLKGITSGVDTIIYSVTNTCGTSVTNYIVTVNPLATAGNIFGPNNVCVNDTIALGDSGAFSTSGAWSESNGNAFIYRGAYVRGISAGMDTIIYSTANVCNTATANYVITVNPLPVAGSITGPSYVCVNSTILLTDTVASGRWYESNMLAAISGALQVKGIAPGIDTISYSVSNMCGTESVSHVVTINPLPVAGTISGLQDVCVNDTIQLFDTTASSLSGNWTSANTNVAIWGMLQIKGVAAGKDIISYSISNSCGTAIATYAINVNALPFAGIISGPAVECLGDTITLSDTVADGNWTLNGSNIVSLTESQFVALSSGIDSITYSVENNCGTALATYTVSVNPAPEVPQIVSRSDSLFTESNYSNYQWLLNGSPIPGATNYEYTYHATGLYTVIVSNASGCNASTQTIVDADCPVSELTVFPNPAQSIIYVQWCKPVTLRLNCIDGRLVETLDNADRLNLADLASGVYLLTVFYNGQSISTQKILKL